MQNRKLVALLATALLLPITSSHADENQGASDVVVAKKSLKQLRNEFYASEEAFYELFNELNDDDQYDVRCYYERRTGTRIKNHICRARFVSDAFSAHAARNKGKLSSVSTQGSDPEFVRQSAEFEEKLSTTVANNPELLAALEKFTTARANYAAKKNPNGKH